MAQKALSTSHVPCADLYASSQLSSTPLNGLEGFVHFPLPHILSHKNFPGKQGLSPPNKYVSFINMLSIDLVPPQFSVLCWAHPNWKESSTLNLASKNGKQRSTAKSTSRVRFSTARRLLPEEDAKELQLIRSSSSQEKVKEIVLKQAALARKCKAELQTKWNLDEAYDLCFELAVKEISKLFLPFSNSLVDALTSLIIKALTFQKPEQRKYFSAIVVWVIRTDELVDGINGSRATLEVLDRWEQRLIDLFQGCPYDIYDAALSDTVLKRQIDVQLFKDFIDGMRLDLKKKRYENFDELYLYCYHVLGTVGLMCGQFLEIKPDSKASLESLYEACFTCALAIQLADILHDIKEDANMGRIYLPQDELASAGLSDDDVFTATVNDKWRNFMKEQIKRVRIYSDEGEKIIHELHSNNAWVVSLFMRLNRQKLDNIEANDYNITKKASMPTLKQLVTLLQSFKLQ